ncbi:hypothetical protein [Ochrobactrum chromiisoli]|uniref:Tail assembly chaperone n=1 Tax=Ochrobactrum chromiisoli TaxID=2993941 RepID=A0ABT3QHS2_9HYPH|nr:hypothetical protein [Ochrobactrum chromiisoli]MCX2695158.1 hypothetical protein [Ochrobactrum chromiisoli]
MVARYIDEYPIVDYMGRKFYAVPKVEVKEEIFSLPNRLLPEGKPEQWPKLRQQEYSERSIPGDGDIVLFPVEIEINEDEKPFPSAQIIGEYLCAGLSTHRIPEALKRVKEAGGIFITFKDVEVFDDDANLQLMFDYSTLLEELGWTEFGEISPMLREKLDGANIGEAIFSMAGEEMPECPDFWVIWMASTLFSAPFSRIWYVTNLMILAAAKSDSPLRDDLRLGFLWREYVFKKKHEWAAEKHLELVSKNRENGRKGGQAEKKAERYEVLNRLARINYKEIVPVSEPES